MISMYKFDQIRDFIKQGLSDSEIARRVGIHRKTVARYKRANAPPRYSSRRRASRDDPSSGYQEEIAKLTSGDDPPSARAIYQKLYRLGYRGSQRTIERRVATILSARPKERYFSQSYEPGEQSQLDFKEELPLPFVSGEKVVQVFIGSLPYSGVYFAKAFPNKTFEAFIDGLHSFFENIGGMSQKIRFDNLSPVVKKVLKGRERIYTAAFERAHSYYGFGLLPCRPGSGSDKGDVERDVRTFASRLKDALKIERPCFQDFDDLNQWLVQFCEADRSEKTSQLFAKEKECLAGLPARDENVLSKVAIMAVSKYGIVRVGKSSYSVPDRCIGRDVKIVVSAYDVKIYGLGARKDLLATHSRMPDYQNSILLQHSLRSLLRKPQAMVRWAHRDILFPSPTFRRYYELLKQIDPLGAEREFLRSVNLIQHTSFEDIEAAMSLVVEREGEDPYGDLSELLLAGPPSAQLQNQPPIVVNLKQYDALIPTPTQEDDAS